MSCNRWLWFSPERRRACAFSMAERYYDMLPDEMRPSIRKYVNHRVEMWGSLREWLEDGAQVPPDDDALHAELTRSASASGTPFWKYRKSR
jgi:hypothetical protein